MHMYIIAKRNTYRNCIRDIHVQTLTARTTIPHLVGSGTLWRLLEYIGVGYWKSCRVWSSAVVCGAYRAQVSELLSETVFVARIMRTASWLGFWGFGFFYGGSEMKTYVSYSVGVGTTPNHKAAFTLVFRCCRALLLGRVTLNPTE